MMPELLFCFFVGTGVIAGLLMGGILTVEYYHRKERRAREEFELAEARNDFSDPKEGE
jgi:hypothetical protein